MKSFVAELRQTLERHVPIERNSKVYEVVANYSARKLPRKFFLKREHPSLLGRHSAMLTLDEAQLTELVNGALQKPDARVLDSTFLIHPLSEVHAPFRTILLDISGEHVVTKEASTQLMSARFEQLRMPYDLQRRYYTWLFGRSYRAPYVLAERAYLPIVGLTRHQTAWIGLHHVHQYYVSEYEEVVLQLANRQKMLIPMAYQAFRTKISEIARMYQLLRFYAFYLAERHRMFQITDTKPMKNIITDYAQQHPMRRPPAEIHEAIGSVLRYMPVVEELETCLAKEYTLADVIEGVKGQLESFRQQLVD